MMSDLYILKNKTPVKVDDVLEWGKSRREDRIVGKTMIGDIYVSTVFLWRDHSFLEGADPILFETMIFGGDHDGYQERYTTWEGAEVGHLFAVNLVNKVS